MTRNPNRVKVTGVDGRQVSLASLPLVAYTLKCGHMGKDYAVMKGDLVFCDNCADTMTVTRIIAG